MQFFRRFNGLSSISGSKIMARMPQMIGKSPLIPKGILETFGFFDHNFAPRNARKSNQGSKDLYYSLVSNKVLSPKIG